MFNKSLNSPIPAPAPKIPTPAPAPASSDSDVEKIKAWKPGSKVRLEEIEASRYMELKHMFADGNEFEFVYYEENKVLVIK
tara:strand:+ start:438 stop:680 length:243 start_codon:yes stop_codon:yes gene_type:complete